MLSKLGPPPPQQTIREEPSNEQVQVLPAETGAGDGLSVSKMSPALQQSSPFSPYWVIVLEFN